MEEPKNPLKDRSSLPDHNIGGHKEKTSAFGNGYLEADTYFHRLELLLICKIGTIQLILKHFSEDY